MRSILKPEMHRSRWVVSLQENLLQIKTEQYNFSDIMDVISWIFTHILKPDHIWTYYLSHRLLCHRWDSSASPPSCVRSAARGDRTGAPGTCSASSALDELRPESRWRASRESKACSSSPLDTPPGYRPCTPEWEGGRCQREVWIYKTRLSIWEFKAELQMIPSDTDI